MHNIEDRISSLLHHPSLSLQFTKSQVIKKMIITFLYPLNFQLLLIKYPAEELIYPLLHLKQ
jgi:hypothetical protein